MNSVYIQTFCKCFQNRAKLHIKTHRRTKKKT